MAKSALILRDQRRCGRVVLKDFPGPLQVIKQGVGKCPNWTSPKYWGYDLQQVLESDVQNAQSGTFTKACQNKMFVDHQDAIVLTHSYFQIVNIDCFASIKIHHNH